MKSSADEIMTEVWQNRDEYVKAHRNDLNAICEDLKKRQAHPFGKLADRRKRQKTKVC